MRKKGYSVSGSRWGLLPLLLVAICALTACDNDLIVSPTVTGIDISPGPIESVAVIANLSTAEPVCQEATLLYDGQELDGARATCVEASNGCSELQLDAIAPAEPGSHTIGIEVLRQKRATATYEISGEVLVSRSGIPPLVVLTLEPRVRELQVGDRVTYEIYIPD